MDKEINAKTIQPQKSRGFGRTLILLLSYVIVGVAVWQIQARLNNDVTRQNKLAEQEVKDLVTQVGKLIIVPQNETPQVATIQDAAGLAKIQDFFINVKNGDKVLVYVADKKAIVYRPSENKIVNVGPVVSENATSTTPKAPAPAKASTTSDTASSSKASE